MTLRYLHSSCNHTHALFIVSLFVFVSSASFAQSVQGIYPIQNFSPSDYKAGIQNIDFAQNRDMQIFVANNLCVLSFNGTEWGRYNYKNGKKNRSLVFDEQLNRLYVGAQGEIGYFEEDWSYISLTSAIPESNQDFDEVWDVFLQGEKVYFCTFQGIYIYDGNAISIINHPDGLERCFSVNRKIFVQSQQSVLYEING
ncbi:MAG: hypothetical protein HRU12_15360, partial [Phaeodactylibacter sp.]|nr:hypothetical protein [Phaeodactylibacter sp.]